MASNQGNFEFRGTYPLELTPLLRYNNVMKKSYSNSLPAQLNGREKASRTAHLLLGLSVLLVFILLLCFALTWGYKTCYKNNRHFTLLNLDYAPTANYDRNRVLTMLSEMGLDIGHANLMQMDLKAIHDRFASESRIRNARVRRILPDTLHISLTERFPEALLQCNPQLFIDRDGTIMAYADFVDVPGTITRITGIRNTENLKPGTVTNDPMLLAALQLLEQLRLFQGNAMYDIALIQLEQGQRQFRLLMRKTSANSAIQDGAIIIFPAEQQDAAFRRLHAIVEHKIKTNSTLSFADVTYETNVPTRE